MIEYLRRRVSRNADIWWAWFSLPGVHCPLLGESDLWDMTWYLTDRLEQACLIGNKAALCHDGSATYACSKQRVVIIIAMLDKCRHPPRDLLHVLRRHGREHMQTLALCLGLVVRLLG